MRIQAANAIGTSAFSTERTAFAGADTLNATDDIVFIEHDDNPEDDKTSEDIVFIEDDDGPDPLTAEFCDTPGAICTGDGRRLTNRLRATVAGPPTAPLTAEFTDVPASHTGSGTLTVRVEFSTPIDISFRTMRDKSVTGDQQGTAPAPSAPTTAAPFTDPPEITITGPG